MLVGPAGSDTEFPLWPPLLASRGPGGRSAKHAHHALHVMLALEGELRVRGLGDWQRGAGVVTAPDAAHEIDATGVEVLLVFLDPESAAGTRLLGLAAPVDRAEERTRRGRSGEATPGGRALAKLRESRSGTRGTKSRDGTLDGGTSASSRFDRFRLIAAAERDQLIDLAPAQLMRHDGVEWAQRVVDVLGGAQPSAARESGGRRSAIPSRIASSGVGTIGRGGRATASGEDAIAAGAGGIASDAGVSDAAGRARRVHPAVRRALRHLRTLAPSQDQSLAALAKVAGLSEGRFMHAFTESVGIPLRPYLAWLKLQRAAAAIVTGSTLAEAAYGAGFADAAHMTRAFRRMFGVRPSELRKP